MLGTNVTVTLLSLTGGRTLTDIPKTLHTRIPHNISQRNDSSSETNHKSYSYENRDKLCFLKLHDFVTKNLFIKVTLDSNRGQ